MDLRTYLENAPLSKWHVKFLLITAAAWAFDAMDTGIISFVIAELARQWGLSGAQIGALGSSGLAGMALGAMFAGGLADKFGRKKVLLAMMVLAGAGSILCAISWDFASLLSFRCVVGFGLGGQLPVAVTLVSEYAPAKHRGKMLVWLESSWAVGWLAAAVTAYFAIPKLGWQSAFYIGAAPIIWALVIAKTLPESMLFLLKNGRENEALSIVKNINKDALISGVKNLPQDTAPKKRMSGANFTILFSKEFIKRTICLWALWFGLVFSYYGIFMWLPTLLFKAGFDIVKSFWFVLIMTLAQIPGYVAAALLVDRIGRKNTLGAFLLGSAAAAYFFGGAQNEAQIIVWGCLMSFFNLGAWGVIYAYTPENYPTKIRATGSGWASACGRVGGIVAPMAVAWLFTDASKFSLVFALFAAVLIAAAIIVMLIGKETKQEALEF